MATPQKGNTRSTSKKAPAKKAPSKPANGPAPAPAPTTAPSAVETAQGILDVIASLIGGAGETPTNLHALQERLAEPFRADQIEWKPGAVSRDKKKGLAMGYVTNRAIQERLDDVLGVGNWQNVYQPGPAGGVVCGISIRIVRENGRAEWVTKFDGADNSQVEEVKGGLSNSMKRAASQLGIGRYLYSVPSQWVELDERGRFKRTPEIPPAYLPKSPDEKRRVMLERVKAEKAFHATGVDFSGDQEAWNEKRPKMIEWFAEKFGIELLQFSTHELLTPHLVWLTGFMKERIDREKGQPSKPAPQKSSPQKGKPQQAPPAAEEPEEEAAEEAWDMDEDFPW